MTIDPRAWGIDEGYWDASGRWQEVPAATVQSLLGAMDAGDDRQVPPRGEELRFMRAGQAQFLDSPADLVLEDGTSLGVVEVLAPDLPPGYHRLVGREEAAATTLVVSPGRCPLPRDVRAWGWAVQVHAARSRTSWGLGDLADLRRLAGWASSLGAGVLALSPLHAPGPALPQVASPYYPSSRRFGSPLYLRVEEVPGAEELGPALVEAAAAGRAMNETRHLDRDRVWSLKAGALAACFERFAGADGFDVYCHREGEALERYATWCAIAEVHGNHWPHWPHELRRPDASGIEPFADGHRQRVRFHAWLQWLIEEQLRRAGDSISLVHDLAVGFDPGGADAWEWQDLLALDHAVGAPPDEFNPDGQDWGLPPFVPWRLRAAGYEPFVRTLRAALRSTGGLRVDHVMGLFRLFWVPQGAGPAAGAYVRYSASELLDILTLESHRAGAFVIGEDLGTVEDQVREELAERRILSTRLLWFEAEPPRRWPEQSLATITTHDLPTVAGLWTGADLAARRRIGVRVSVEGTARVRRRLQETAGVGDGATVDDVVVAAHRALAGAPSYLRVATLEDAMAVEERPNMPGTTDAWPNWSLALPEPIEALETDRRALAVAEAMEHEQ